MPPSPSHGCLRKRRSVGDFDCHQEEAKKRHCLAPSLGSVILLNDSDTDEDEGRDLDSAVTNTVNGAPGLLKGIVSGLALNGYTTVTFDMRGIGKSTSRASLTGFSEVKDVIVVCNCLSNTFSVPRILLLGSSISAPIAGSAIDQIEQVIGYVSIGYPFRMNALILFG
ncbi:hypothetical protein JHK84_032050 [Glycine max]|nr:hypothetical protein JHK85_032476 [Glycine max]KAG4995084.1 hypothetical protein JHK86_031911 [Glycine max]KAG5146507.1 hypothetical protein JHK84_032050 [Glycine max]